MDKFLHRGQFLECVLHNALVAAHASPVKTVVFMPALNAAKTVQKTFEAIPADAAAEVILVDNASMDGTADIAAALPRVTVIRHTENRGYGGSQKTGYDESLRRGADIVIMVHADFQYDPGKIPDMIAPIKAGTADMVSGSRFLIGDPRTHGMSWWRYTGNRFLTTMQNVALGIHLSEAHSGYRAYARTLLERVPYHSFSDDFVFDAQMIAAVARRKMRIAEVSIPTRYRSDSSSISFRSSVRYGLATLLTLFQRK